MMFHHILGISPVYLEILSPSHPHHQKSPLKKAQRATLVAPLPDLGLWSSDPARLVALRATHVAAGQPCFCYVHMGMGQNWVPLKIDGEY